MRQLFSVCLQTNYSFAYLILFIGFAYAFLLFYLSVSYYFNHFDEPVLITIFKYLDQLRSLVLGEETLFTLSLLNLSIFNGK